MFYLVEAKTCSINEMVFIVLHVTNNIINIVQMLAIIILHVLIEFDYHSLKIHA